MGTYERPGVYIEEIPLFPPSVAGVSTAVPALIGYTESGPQNVAVRITNLREFESIFGGPPKLSPTISISEEVNSDADVEIEENITETNKKKFILYYAMHLMFQYGDVPCYVISIGNYDEVTFTVQKYQSALSLLEKEDEPTLLLFPDASRLLLTKDDYYQLCFDALNQCQKLKDRFTIIDVVCQKNKDNIDLPQSKSDFRNSTMDNLKYGAAYFPYLNTAYIHAIDEESTLVTDKGTVQISIPLEGLGVSYLGKNNIAPDIEILDSKPAFYESKVEDIWNLEIRGVGNGVEIDKFENNPLSIYRVYRLGIQEEESQIAPPKTLHADSLFYFISGQNGLKITFPRSVEELTEMPSVNIKEGDQIFVQLNGTKKLLIALPKEGIVAKRILDAIASSNLGEFEIEIMGNGEELINPGETILNPVIGFPYSINNEAKFLITYGGDKTIQTLQIKKFDFVVQGGLNTPKLSIIGVGANGASAADITRASVGLNLNPFKVTHIQQSGSDNPIPTSGLLKDYVNKRAYSFIIQKLNKENRVIDIPPSGAIAGLYAKVDRERGVWKAPANVGLSGVIGPSIKITDSEHNGLNLDPDAGKSINAIRNYTGKGTLVMGARTLAGNDNEWRYINVRRLFNMVEESVKKATEAFIFEPNNITTWLKVKGMIESYLYGLWQRGALVGNTPEQAYFVNVGLGKTMTAQDILEGFMKVDIGMAAVRPAEFIILRFSHKMQEA